MKNIFNIYNLRFRYFIGRILVLFILFIYYSCESFVELDLPDSQINASAVFEDPQTAQGAIGELYSSLRDESILMGGNNGIGFLMGLYTDELDNFNTSSPDTQEFYQNTVTANNNHIKSWWQSSYNLIYSCNRAIEGLEASSGIPDELSMNLIGQAIFLRTVVLYYLSEVYGDIPYTLSTDYQTNTNISRTKKEELLGFLIDDLLRAEELLAETQIDGERIYPTKDAARAMLSRIFLESGNSEKAQVYASKLIENIQYSLSVPLESVFQKESLSTIWQLKPGQPGKNTLEAQAFIFTTLPPPNNALRNDLVNSFDSVDLRLENWISTVTDSTSTYYHAAKYKLQESSATSEEYSILLRMAEQYLIRAEARFMMGDKEGAVEDLNMIRERAGLDLLTIDEISKEIIAREWFHEYFTEFGHRFISLKRLQLTDEILNMRKQGWNPEDELLPLPESELLINPNLEPQNPGY